LDEALLLLGVATEQQLVLPDSGRWRKSARLPFFG
jgi:hypothetical protein